MRAVEGPKAPVGRPDEHPALELDVRSDIFHLVEDKPGIHLRAIQKRLDLPYGTTTYHLNYLEKADLVTAKMDGGYKRYYSTHSVGRRDKAILQLLRQRVPRRVCTHLLLDPGLTHQELLEEFDLSASTLSYHLKKLTDGEVVRAEKEGRHTHYFVEERDDVARLLIAYKPSFVDDVVDRFVEAWLDVEP